MNTPPVFGQATGAPDTGKSFWEQPNSLPFTEGVASRHYELAGKGRRLAWNRISFSSRQRKSQAGRESQTSTPPATHHQAAAAQVQDALSASFASMSTGKDSSRRLVHLTFEQAALFKHKDLEEPRHRLEQEIAAFRCKFAIEDSKSGQPVCINGVTLQASQTKLCLLPVCKHSVTVQAGWEKAAAVVLCTNL